MTTPHVQTVLVPLDGSERAEQALRPAVQLAERLDAELVLMTTQWEATRVETVQRYLDVHIALLERDARPLVVLDREAPEAILLAARDSGALVCMTTHGRSGMASAALGSVAEAVVRGSNGPVVLIGTSDAARLGTADITDHARRFRRLSAGMRGRARGRRSRRGARRAGPRDRDRAAS